MMATELEEIHKYWSHKYPYVDIRLWGNEDGTQYFGQMLKKDRNVHLQADTIGKLISLGEDFLRKVE